LTSKLTFLTSSFPHKTTQQNTGILTTSLSKAMAEQAQQRLTRKDLVERWKKLEEGVALSEQANIAFKQSMQGPGPTDMQRYNEACATCTKAVEALRAAKQSDNFHVRIPI
jgi:hypothetical protein